MKDPISLLTKVSLYEIEREINDASTNEYRFLPRRRLALLSCGRSRGIRRTCPQGDVTDEWDGRRLGQSRFVSLFARDCLTRAGSASRCGEPRRLLFLFLGNYSLQRQPVSARIDKRPFAWRDHADRRPLFLDRMGMADLRTAEMTPLRCSGGCPQPQIVLVARVRTRASIPANGLTGDTPATTELFRRSAFLI